MNPKYFSYFIIFILVFISCKKQIIKGPWNMQLNDGTTTINYDAFTFPSYDLNDASFKSNSNLDTSSSSNVYFRTNCTFSCPFNNNQAIQFNLFMDFKDSLLSPQLNSTNLYEDRFKAFEKIINTEKIKFIGLLYSRNSNTDSLWIVESQIGSKVKIMNTVPFNNKSITINSNVRNKINSLKVKLEFEIPVHRINNTNEKRILKGSMFTFLGLDE